MTSSIAKAILGEGDAYEFSFNDQTNAVLLADPTIPPAVENERGLLRKARGIELEIEDFQPIMLALPFRLVGSSIANLTTKQSVLLKALKKPRNKFTWNANPAVNADIIFDTYASPLDLPLDIAYFIQSKGSYLLQLLADAQPYAAEITAWDQVAVLGQVDGESGEWSASDETGANAPEDSTKYRQGSKSARTEGAAGANSWILRAAVNAQSLALFAPTGWVTARLQLDTVPAAMTMIRVRIGSDSSNYRRYDITAPYGDPVFKVGWQTLFFNYNAPTAVVGSPVLTAVDYFYYECVVTSGNGPAFNIDNVHLVNGKACNVRGQTPLRIHVGDITTEYDCGFKMDIKAGDEKLLVTADNDETIGEYTKDGDPGGDTLAFSTGSFYWKVTEGSHFLLAAYPSLRSGSSGFHRTPSVGIDLSSLTAGVVEFDVSGSCLDGTVAYNDLTMEIRIGNDSTHYVKTTKTLFGAGTYWTDPHSLSFNMADMVAGVGVVTWTNPINYIGASFSRASGTWQANVGLDNMRVHEPGAHIDLIYLMADGSDVVSPLGPLTVPESLPAPTGSSWEAIPAASNLAGTFGGQYYRWSIGTATKYIYQCKVIGNRLSGEGRLLVRLRHSDTGGGKIGWVGYDQASNEWFWSNTVDVPYNAGKWQTVDIGPLALPFDGFHRDAVLSEVFSVVGLAVTSVGAAKNWDINVLEAANTEGGAIVLTPAVGKRFLCLDTRYIDSKGFSQGESSNYNTHAVQRNRERSVLDTVRVGDNSAMIVARDSSDPDNVPSIEIPKFTYVPRLKNGKSQ